MRIGTQAFFQGASDTVARWQKELGAMTEALSSGKRISRPSDDPLGMTIVARSHTQLAAGQARERVFEMGQRTLRAAEGALGTVGDELRTVINAALRVLQPGSTGAALQAAASEIRSATETILTAGNAKAGDRYLFGGYQDRAVAFEKVAGVVQYNGDSGQLSVPIGSNRTCPISVSGQDLFNYDGGSGRAVPQVDADVFTLLEDLASALEAEDIDGARVLVDNVRILHQHTLESRAYLGASERRLQMNVDAIADSEIRLHEVLAEEESLDIAQVISEYAVSETSYQAMLNVLSRLMALPTIFDLTRY